MAMTVAQIQIQIDNNAKLQARLMNQLCLIKTEAEGKPIQAKIARCAQMHKYWLSQIKAARVRQVGKAQADKENREYRERERKKQAAAARQHGKNLDGLAKVNAAFASAAEYARVRRRLVAGVEQQLNHAYGMLGASQGSTANWFTAKVVNGAGGTSTERPAQIVRGLRKKIQGYLDRADRAVGRGDLKNADRWLNMGIRDVNQVARELQGYENKIKKGGARTEIGIKVVAAVAAAAAGGASVVALKKAGILGAMKVAGSGAVAHETTGLITKAQREKISPAEYGRALARVGINVALAGLGGYLSQRCASKLAQMALGTQVTPGQIKLAADLISSYVTANVKQFADMLIAWNGFNYSIVSGVFLPALGPALSKHGAPAKVGGKGFSTWGGELDKKQREGVL